MHTDKVRIIGKSPTKELIPPDRLLWGVNDVCLAMEVDVVFQMHKIEEIINEGQPLVLETKEYVIKNKKPFITVEELKDIPTSIRFPLEEMHTDYFTSSLAYMVAYAIHIGVTEIDIHGVQMLKSQNDGEEFSQQKPCVEYWIGYARGKGIKVEVHDESALLVAHDRKLYGYNTYQKLNSVMENTITYDEFLKNRGVENENYV